MATYFHGNTEMQGNADGLQTLILMNPPYFAYSDHHHQLSSSFMFLNSGSSVNHSQIQAAADSSPQYREVSELPGGSLPCFQYNLHNGAAREVTGAQQGLSLSLSPKQAPLHSAEEVRVPNSVVLSCKYLKVAQALLDEVVYIGKEAKNGSQSAKGDSGQPKTCEQLSATVAGDGPTKQGAELTTAQKQEIQMKKAKLVSMLDEVEQRYKQYRHEMQMVITWFEQAAGEGSAQTYTALALQTISKQFRCLKDAILDQIRVAAKNLGQEESLGGKMEGSRLRNIGIQIRQQQLGMIQHNAWRPQRGLPESSVSVLRAWLFEHFLHPYPKDTDKIVLAKQTGLTRSQVSNWFINARVRLWKPMVEEMYAEEVKGPQQGRGSKDEIAAMEMEIKNDKPRSTEATAMRNVTGSPETESRSPKKPRDAGDTSQPPTSIDVDQNQHIAMNFFASCPIQFQPPYSGSNVSLTLGLQHCENLPVSFHRRA